MAEQFPVVQDDAYEEMAATYQALEVARLNDVLKRYEVPDQARREICQAYSFEAGAFLDSGWLRVVEGEGVRLYPTLCFAERPVDPHEGLGDITTLHAPSPSFSFHEYAGGAISVYFDDRSEAIDDIEHG